MKNFFIYDKDKSEIVSTNFNRRYKAEDWLKRLSRTFPKKDLLIGCYESHDNGPNELIYPKDFKFKN